jgi:sirohydrochlorin cobaltochelatase
VTPDDEIALAGLDDRLRTLLPEQYQDRYEDVEPKSMGSAPLKRGEDGQVAWDEMWATFCDLAMAGGPPHKGTLLQPASPAAVAAEPDRYRDAVEEIDRGIRMSAGLETEGSLVPGWISVACCTETMAEWLVRAIVMENVAARQENRWIELPVGPAFRLEKEIKNVVTVVAKTSHYWLGHMPAAQQRAIGYLLTTLNASFPLVVPTTWCDGLEDGDDSTSGRMSDRIQSATGLRPSQRRNTGWLGVECPNVRAAVWLMRALVVSNVLARREETALFLPLDARSADRVVDALVHLHGLATARGVL